MKNMNNLIPSNQKNEFITIYDDTYEILPNFTWLNAISAALTDFAMHVTKNDLSLFWVNYVAEDQSSMYIKEVFDGNIGEDKIMFTSPAILIGWTKSTDKLHHRFYWLRLVDGKINVVVTYNIGDIMRVVTPCTTNGIHITTDETGDDVEYSDTDVLVVGSGMYYTILRGLAKVIESYTSNMIGTIFNLSMTETKNISQITSKHSIYGPSDTMTDTHVEYPVSSDNLSENYFITATAMLHDFVKNHVNHTLPKVIDIYNETVMTDDASTASVRSVIIGTQIVNDTKLIYMVNNIAGHIHVDIKRAVDDKFINVISMALSSTELYIDEEFEALVICAINDITKLL